MASIQGDDHRRLADLLVLLIQGVEERLRAIELQRSGDDARIEALTERIDELNKKLDGGASGWSAVIIRNPWLVPVSLVLGAVLFGGEKVLELVR